MLDRNGKPIKEGQPVKYSFNEIGIPVFTGTTVLADGVLYIEHSNKVRIELDDRIKFVEIINQSY